MSSLAPMGLTLAEIDTLPGRCRLWQRRRCSAVRRTKRLERAPVAELALLVAPVAGLARFDDRAGQCLHLTLDAQQIGFVRVVVEDLTVGEVVEPQLRRDHTDRPPKHQRVEPELEERLALELLAGRLAGLVVDDAQPAVDGTVEPVDEPLQ